MVWERNWPFPDTCSRTATRRQISRRRQSALRRRIARRFRPEKIILFGSYAYGTPHEESDVDLLVIMPTRNAIDQAVRIKMAFDRPFSLDLIVPLPGGSIVA